MLYCTSSYLYALKKREHPTTPNFQILTALQTWQLLTCTVFHTHQSQKVPVWCGNPCIYNLHRSKMDSEKGWYSCKKGTTRPANRQPLQLSLTPQNFATSHLNLISLKKVRCIITPIYLWVRVSELSEERARTNKPLLWVNPRVVNHLLARRERHVSFFAWAKKVTHFKRTHACEAGGLWLRRCPWTVGRPWRAIAMRQTDVLLTQPGGRPESFRHRFPSIVGFPGGPRKTDNRFAKRER